eukprot:CAMPEP_0206024316 /NCGR_PEP_ID=MMETSP1464-20131121/37988_1 /ASSEMBLY_ACC=CAM_ASM_001124 /TAXON_ID=119497 /ORGANISM="Exanthemachrysis gayraliae, Strain RCC1523" /LENGTH=135 /DNA_ID=CAMNT_0053398319 /DNA_START=114 /DNA_END=517 /DNA_ORIENTATION=+
MLRMFMSATAPQGCRADGSRPIGGAPPRPNGRMQQLPEPPAACPRRRRSLCARCAACRRREQHVYDAAIVTSLSELVVADDSYPRTLRHLVNLPRPACLAARAPLHRAEWQRGGGGGAPRAAHARSAGRRACSAP